MTSNDSIDLVEYRTDKRGPGVLVYLSEDELKVIDELKRLFPHKTIDWIIGDSLKTYLTAVKKVNESRERLVNLEFVVGK